MTIPYLYVPATETKDQLTNSESNAFSLMLHLHVVVVVVELQFRQCADTKVALVLNNQAPSMIHRPSIRAEKP